MNITGTLTVEDLQEILKTLYQKGFQSEEMSTSDLLDEIKESIITLCTSNKINN